MKIIVTLHESAGWSLRRQIQLLPIGWMLSLTFLIIFLRIFTLHLSQNEILICNLEKMNSSILSESEIHSKCLKSHAGNMLFTTFFCSLSSLLNNKACCRSFSKASAAYWKHKVYTFVTFTTHQNTQISIFFRLIKNNMRNTKYCTNCITNVSSYTDVPNKYRSKKQISNHLPPHQVSAIRSTVLLAHCFHWLGGVQSVCEF